MIPSAIPSQQPTNLSITTESLAATPQDENAKGGPMTTSQGEDDNDNSNRNGVASALLATGMVAVAAMMMGGFVVQHIVQAN